MGFHLWHGFQSAFQTLGAQHARYTPVVKKVGYGFSVLIPAAFAVIPLYLYFTQA
jgi:succinate dehydrogenase / fumarate reductase cytochrome b subunit